MPHISIIKVAESKNSLKGYCIAAVIIGTLYATDFYNEQ